LTVCSRSIVSAASAMAPMKAMKAMKAMKKAMKAMKAMKRSTTSIDFLASHTRAMGPFPLPAPISGRIMLVGGVYVDIANEVASYPEEDSAQRALSTRRTRGGNAGNSCAVAAQLTAGRGDVVVSWMGVVPSLADADAKFAVDKLEEEGVESSLLEEVGGDTGQPTSFITINRENGSRTIVSTRQRLRELSAEHFTAQLPRAVRQAATLGELRWCHLECRDLPGQLAMARAWHASTELPTPRYLSVEVEKPSMQPKELLPLLASAQAVFLSREFVEKHADEILAKAPPAKKDEPLAPRILKALSAWAASEGAPLNPASNAGAGKGAMWICAWGSTGAYALDTSKNEPIFAPASKVKAIDSIGAGDTFNGTTVHALALGASPEQALRCGCAVAGQKVSQVGFEGLIAAVPKDMPWLKGPPKKVGGVKRHLSAVLGEQEDR